MLRNIELLLPQYFPTSPFLVLLNSHASDWFPFFTEYAEGRPLSLYDLIVVFENLFLLVLRNKGPADGLGVEMLFQVGLHINLQAPSKGIQS